MKFDNLEKRMNGIILKISELQVEIDVLHKEKLFREHLDFYKDFYKKEIPIEKLAGRYLRSNSESINIDRVEWFAEYKQDDERFGKVAKDMNELVKLLNNKEMGLSKARKLKNEFDKYGFNSYFANEKGKDPYCFFCNKEEVRPGASFTLVTDYYSGNALDRGYRKGHKVEIIHDEPVELFKEFKVKVKKDNLEKYLKEAEKKWKRGKNEASSPESVEELTRDYNRLIKLVNKLEDADYYVNIRGWNYVCEKCSVNKEKIAEKINTYNFVKPEWIELELI